MRGEVWPVSLMCEVLEVSASGYFNWKRTQDGPGSGPSRFQSDDSLLAHMRAIHAEIKGEYGWPRMHKELLARGIRVGKERVRVLMQHHGIKARTKRKFVVTTHSKYHLPTARDLVQRPRRPTVLWSGDITYIPTD
jgi:putative transposase